MFLSFLFFPLGFFSTTHISHSFPLSTFFFFFQFIPDHFFSSAISFSFSSSLFFLLFLFLLDSRTLSPSISLKQILSHTHRSLAKKWRSVFYMFFFFFGSDFIRLMRKIVFVFQIFRLGSVFLF